MAIAQTLGPIVGGKILKRAKWSWLGYGVAAYAGLYVLRRLGIFENAADRGMRIMEKGASMATGRNIGRGAQAGAQSNAFH